MRRLCISAAMLLVPVLLAAKVTLPSIIGDNMVLQQQTDAALWGSAKASSKVTISASWSGKKTVVTADSEGKWSARIATPQAGGPYTITFSDGEKTTISNVLIGEVWFCSGQSNMEMPVKGIPGQRVEGAADCILGARKSTPIRICNISKRTSATECSSCRALWLENCPDAVADCSAAAYFFASQLNTSLDVPVGIITSYWGGTPIETWMNRETFEKEFPDIDLSHLDAGKLPEKSQLLPCTLFNGMVAPVIPFTIKGWIWYQGENNRGFEDMYRKLQPAYARMMRKLWNAPEMPFYFVQIAPFAFQGKPDGDVAARLMEAQALSLQDIPHSGMVTTADIGECWCIHPKKKKEVGQRLAMLALRNDYGFSLRCAIAPSFKEAVFADGKATVTFKDADLGLGPVNIDIEGFELAGEDRVFHPATGRLRRDRVTLDVTSPEVSNPVAVRYIFHNYAPGILVNNCGLPVGPFRSDDWPSEDK